MTFPLPFRQLLDFFKEKMKPFDDGYARQRPQRCGRAQRLQQSVAAALRRTADPQTLCERLSWSGPFIATAQPAFLRFASFNSKLVEGEGTDGKTGGRRTDARWTDS